MADRTPYTQGYSASTLSTHLARTAESDAAFLLPHIRPTDHILDVGCGPGTITVGLAAYVPSGRVVGVDVSALVLEKARSVAAASSPPPPSSGAGSVAFHQADVLAGLPFADGAFDVVFASHLFGHLPPPLAGLPLRALQEMRRVLRPGGLVATRDGAAQHFFPARLGLDALWAANFERVVRHSGGGGGEGAADEEDATGASMPRLYRLAGFAADEGKVRVGGAVKVFAGRETREWLAERTAAQLAKGDAFRQSWIDAGIAEEEIDRTVQAARLWAETEDAWGIAVQCEVLAWK